MQVPFQRENTLAGVSVSTTRGPHSHARAATRMKPRLAALAALAALAIIAISGCADIAAPSAARVQFRMESLLCGPIRKFALTFHIDSTTVGTDSFSDGQKSTVFATTPGIHHLSATIPGWTSTGDTTLVLKADTTFTTRVSVYCS